MGSPNFALPTLKALAEVTNVIGVVTQPDRPAGRGQVLAPPPVKFLADELHIEVIQPSRLREPEAFAKLQEWKPDLIVVAAFGQILRPEVLNLPPLGCLNVHASLLPRWRGAAPIQAAIFHGDPTSGVTIMRMDTGIDTGDMLTRRDTIITSNDTAESLTARLADLGAKLLIDTLPEFLKGAIRPEKQDEAQATYAPMINKKDGLLDFLTRSAEELARQVRAYNPWPGAYFDWNGQRLKVLGAEPLMSQNIEPGCTTIIQQTPAVGTREGLLLLTVIQPGGKKPMSGQVFLNGARNWSS